MDNTGRTILRLRERVKILEDTLHSILDNADSYVVIQEKAATALKLSKKVK